MKTYRVRTDRARSACRQWYAENAEYKKKRHRAHYAEHREKILERATEYYNNHAEHCKKRNLAYYYKHRDEIAARRRKT